MSDFPAALAVLPNPVETRVQADYLALFDRLFPAEYMQGMKAGAGPGYELYQGAGRLGERLNLALRRLAEGLFLLSAKGGAKATAAVEFLGTAGMPVAGAMKAGAIVATSRGGRRFVLTADVPFAAYDISPKAAVVQAIAPGEEYNVAGPGVDADGVAYDGEIDTITYPLQDPPYWNPTIIVRQTADATGGRSAMLDALGADRGMPRVAGEGDAAYRQRLVFLPDTVSPDAIVRQLARFFAPLGITATFLEMWQPQMRCHFNVPGGASVAGAFFWSDPRASAGFRNRLVSETTCRGAFAVIVPAFPSLAQHGFFYNDPALTQAARTNPNGSRAVAAWSVPASYAAGLAPAFNGADSGKIALRQALSDLLQKVKAGGVFAVVAMGV